VIGKESGPGRAPAGVVHEQIDRVVFGDETGLDAIEIVTIDQVGANHFRFDTVAVHEFVGQFVQHLLAARDEHDIDPSRRKLASERLPDPRRCSGYQRPPPLRAHAAPPLL
jgi:hypothetical protein